MKIEIEEAEYGIIYKLDDGENKIKKVFRCDENDNENINEMETLADVFREMMQDFGVFNSKHNSYRLNIEVEKDE